MNKLEQLTRMTDVVADTGDIAEIERFRPLDATTNPSLLLQAARLPKYENLISNAISLAASSTSSPVDRVRLAAENFAVAIGTEILKVIPGRVSTEIDARLSFNTKKSVETARRLISLYQENGVAPERVLIKAASTWEGIRACEILEDEGINCNLTLLFSEVQAIAAAEAGAFLISPFVGRILDWYKKSEGQTEYAADDDPGVQSVRKIHALFKARNYKTVVMGASFRNVDEIEALAGCDRLTIAPALLEQLAADTGDLPRRIDSAEFAATTDVDFSDEAEFRFLMNQNAMATEKLAEGIRGFVADQILLEDMLRRKTRLHAA